METYWQKPLVNVHIGNPLFPDTTLPFKDAIDKFHKESMQVMNGINPGDPTYNTDQNIDNYKSTM